MPDLFLTPASISYLTQFILAQAISLFLIGRLWKRRTRQLGLLTGFFALATLFIGLMLLDAAFSPYHRLLAVYAENTVLALALVFLIQFAYGFPQPYPQHKWETYAALVASLGYFLWEAGYMIYRYVLLLGPGTVVFRPNLAAYSMALSWPLPPSPSCARAWPPMAVPSVGCASCGNPKGTRPGGHAPSCWFLASCLCWVCSMFS